MWTLIITANRLKSSLSSCWPFQGELKNATAWTYAIRICMSQVLITSVKLTTQKQRKRISEGDYP